jgi:hypothetical protein
MMIKKTILSCFVVLFYVYAYAAFGPSGVSNEAYNTTTWDDINGTAPSKNAIRDALVSGAAINGVDISPGNITTTGTVTAGSFLLPVVTKTANYTAAFNDTLLFTNCSTGNITITLPTAVNLKGKEFVVKKIDSSSNVTVIKATGAEIIDGETSWTVPGQYQSFSVVSDNTTWYIK